MKHIAILLLIITAVLVASCNQRSRYRYKNVSPYGSYGVSEDFDYGYRWRVKQSGAGTRIHYDY